MLTFCTRRRQTHGHCSAKLSFVCLAVSKHLQKQLVFVKKRKKTVTQDSMNAIRPITVALLEHGIKFWFSPLHWYHLIWINPLIQIYFMHNHLLLELSYNLGSERIW